VIPSLKKNIAENYFLENDFINLSSLNANRSFNQYAIAVIETTVKIIPLLLFRNIMCKSISLNQEVSNQLLRDTNVFQKKLHHKSTMSSRRRVIKFLVDYAARAGQRVGYEWLIPNRLSTIQIGGLTNSSRQTCCTLLNDLKRQNLVHFNRKKILIRDLEKLENLAYTSNHSIHKSVYQKA